MTQAEITALPPGTLIRCPLCGVSVELLYQQFRSTGEVTGQRYIAHHPSPVRIALTDSPMIGGIECPAGGQIVKPL